MEHTLKILKIENLTPDVKRFLVEKPKNFNFIPGQAVRISINGNSWKNEVRPFTFTSLNSDENLEFTIKIYPKEKYPQHEGFTQQLGQLKVGDEFIIRDVFGTINYQGKGIFIAGGAGITPFIGIFRQLKKDNQLTGNKLFFSNKTSKDIILEAGLIELFKPNLSDLRFILTREENDSYLFDRIDESFLRKYIKDFNTHFYVCGPRKMVESITSILKQLGAKEDSIVFEKFKSD